LALPAIIDSLDSVHHELAEHYQAGQDGRFYLAVNPSEGRSLEDVSGLKSSLAKERANVRKLTQKVGLYDGLDPDSARDALGKIEDMANWTPNEKAKETMEARERQLANKHKLDMEKVNEDLSAMRSRLENQLIKAAASIAIQGAGGNVELLMPHIERQTRMERVDGDFHAVVIDDTGTPRLSMKPGSVDGMDIEELVSSMRDNETYSPAFSGSGATGSGARSSTPGRGGTARHNLSWEQAHDPKAYRAAKEAAESAGSDLHIPTFDE